MAIYKSITTADTFTLVSKGGASSGNINKIIITNHDNSDSCVVIIKLNDGGGSPVIHVINETNIPARASLVLEDGIKFDSSKYKLEAQTLSAVDITIIVE